MKAMVDHEINAVKRAPHDEGPAGTVPQATEQHRHKEIEITPYLSSAIPAQRYIKIISQKCRQRHMPASPKLNDVQSLVGRVEIHRQFDVEAKRQPDCHV